jgi:hypothetical protein
VPVARALGGVLGFVGALLDFYSGSLLLAGTSEMGTVTQSGGGIDAVWGVGMTALGVVLIVTALAEILPYGAQRMGDFGALMGLYGIVMLFVGSMMYAGLTSMQGTLPGLGMLVVGALMVVNGAAMRRTRMM